MQWSYLFRNPITVRIGGGRRLELELLGLVLLHMGL